MRNEGLAELDQGEKRRIPTIAGVTPVKPPSTRGKSVETKKNLVFWKRGGGSGVKENSRRERKKTKTGGGGRNSITQV